MLNIKKKDSKTKGKELKGMQKSKCDAWNSKVFSFYRDCYLFIFLTEELSEASSAAKPKRRFPDFGQVFKLFTNHLQNHIHAPFLTKKYYVWLKQGPQKVRW